MKRNELKSGVILTYVNLLASNVISILYTPYILNTLGQAEYGVYTLVWSVVNYLTVLDLGFSNAIVRYASKYRAEQEQAKEARLYGTFLCAYILIAVAALLICRAIGLNLAFFAKGLTSSEVSVAETLITIGSINIALSFPFSVFRGIVNVTEKFTFIKVIDLMRTLLTPVTTFIILYLGHGSVGLMWAYTLISLAVTLLYVYYVFYVLRQKIVFKLCEKRVLRELVTYSFFTFLGTIVDKIYWGTDQMILSNRKDSETIAIYSIGSNFPNYFISFSTAISGVLLPKLTKVVATQKEDTAKKMSDLFVKVGRLQFWVLSLVLLGFAFLGRQFIAIWAGAEYDRSYWIAMIIMIPSIISLSQNTGISILQARNKVKFRSISYVFIALFNIVISLLLVDRYGGIGCAVGTSMGTILGPIVLMNIYYYKVIQIDIPEYWKNVASMLKAWVLPTIVGVLIYCYAPVHSYLHLLLWAGVFSICFFASAYFLGFNDYEKMLVKSVLTRVQRGTRGGKNMRTLLKKNKVIYRFLCDRYADLQVYRNGKKADKKALRKFRNVHQGDRCFIIGNGPSLTLEDLQRLQGEYTFASNKIYTVFDKIPWRPTYYVVSDNDITPEMYEQSKAFDCGVKAKFFPANFRDDCFGENANAWFYNYVGCDTTGKVPPEFSTDMTRYLTEGFSVAYVAMQMAAYMGFKEIYLLGIDFSWAIYKDCQGNIYENGTAKHRFYEDNHDEDEISIPNVELMENAYKQALKYCDAHGIKIFNATRGGKLNVFQRIEFDGLFENP